METLLETRQISRRFYKGRSLVTAVNGVSFSLGRGEALGIVGESGSGKTTLIKMVTRLLDADEGQILLEGQDITRCAGRELRRVRRQMQLVFQTPQDSFDPRQTLGRGILEGMVNNGVPRREAVGRLPALLERCGLPADYACRYPHEVSGGECQRAAIARAVAVEPELLICDEATSSLDEKTEKDVYQYILETLPDVTLLSVSHRFSTVLKADRILVMEDGRISAQGTNEELLRKSAVYSGLYEEYRRASSEKTGEGTR